MTIRFDMEMEDLLAFQRHFYATNRQLRKQVWTLRSIFFIGGAVFLLPVIAIVSAGAPLQGVIPIALIGCALAWFLLAFLSPKWLMNFNIRRARAEYLAPSSANMFGPTEMVFDEEGFSVDRGGVEGKTPWGSVVKIDQTPDYYFIYISEIAANTIPKRKLKESENSELAEMFDKHITPKK